MEVNEHFSENARKDYALVLRALAGEQKAFVLIMERYQESVYFMLLKMVNNREDAMDLTVDVFAKAFEKLEGYKPDFAFSTWLFKLATNHAIDYLRKRRINHVSLDQIFDREGGADQNLSLASEGPNPEEKSIQKQNQTQLKAIVATLPNRYRMVINLFYFDEFSVEEIALQLNLPSNTVKGQLHRARTLLQTIIRRKNKTGF